MLLNIKNNKNRKEKKCIIFDFDGTIADTFAVAIHIINSNPTRYGIDGIDKNEIPRLRSLSIPYLLREFNINLLKLPLILAKFRKDLQKHINELKPFSNILDIVIELHAQGYFLGILTNNSKNNVVDFLKKERVEHMFSFISSESALFGKGDSLNKLIKRYKLDKKNTIYIGDEVRDIEACHKVQIPIISVTWGFNSTELLEKFNPTYMVSVPQDILNVVGRHFND